MNLKALMIIKAVVCLGFGPLLLFFPGPLLRFLGTSFGPGAALTAREYGAVLVGSVFLTWLARNAADSAARRAIVWHLFIYDGIALIVTLSIQLSGGLNAMGWAIVAVYLFFTLGFGAALIPRRRTV
jgi:hypothetical protein